MPYEFEACLYNPSGTLRELKPITNDDLQGLSVPLLNMTTSKAITKGNTEIHIGLGSYLLLIYIATYSIHYIRTLLN